MPLAGKTRRTDAGRSFGAPIGTRWRVGVGPRLHPFHRRELIVVEGALRVRLHSAAWLALAVMLGSTLLGAPLIAEAKGPDSVLVEQLTWTEIRDAVHGGVTTVIIPVGGTEQSGPFIAVGKHNRRVAILSERIARTLGNALVAPVIAYVPEGSAAPPTSHMRFPGTITVPDDVFEKTLESAANGFKVHGFRNIVFLGDHGGYQDDVRRVVARLNKSWAGSDARAFVPADYYGTSSTGYN